MKRTESHFGQMRWGEEKRRMLIGQDPKLLAGESLVVAMIWVIPSWLVFRAWRRYQRLDSVQSSLRIAMSGLLISEAMLLLVGVVVAVEMTSSARMLSSPQALGAVNLFLCLIALVGPFGAKTPDTVPVRTAITIASTYFLFLWFYAMLAHWCLFGRVVEIWGQEAVKKWFFWTILRWRVCSSQPGPDC
jgi:hypothetical protein